MPVKKEANGRHSIAVEAEVPGTPEQVWQAIATGPGVSSWFVPTEIEERQGGAIRANFGPGMDSLATISEWQPPHRFAAESHDLGENSPVIATEWIVEATSGGTCVVRVVHSLFASDDAWDDQLEGFGHGWPTFFMLLRMYLANFAGLSCRPLQMTGMAALPKEAAWQRLLEGLGLAGVQVGDRRQTAADAPPLTVVVERAGVPEHREELMARIEAPGPGIAHFFAMQMGDQVILSLRLFLYGEKAETIASRDEPLWQAWVAKRFSGA